MSTKTTSDPVARARELLAGLPEQKLDTGSTGVYVSGTSHIIMDGLPVDPNLFEGMGECIPREIYVDDENAKNIALVFGEHHVYYAMLFAEAPHIIRELLKKLDDSCDGEHACPGCGATGCSHSCNHCR